MLPLLTESSVTHMSYEGLNGISQKKRLRGCTQAQKSLLTRLAEMPRMPRNIARACIERGSSRRFCNAASATEASTAVTRHQQQRRAAPSGDGTLLTALTQHRRDLTFKAVRILFTCLGQSFCKPLKPLIFDVLAWAHNRERLAPVKPNCCGPDVEPSQLRGFRFSIQNLKEK